MKKLFMILITVIMFACATALASEHCRLSSSKAVYPQAGGGQITYICFYSCPSGFTFAIPMSYCSSQYIK